MSDAVRVFASWLIVFRSIKHSLLLSSVRIILKGISLRVGCLKNTLVSRGVSRGLPIFTHHNLP